MTLPLFDTRTMISALEQRLPPISFLRDMFFSKEVNVSISKYVDIDVYKGKRRLAPYVNPKMEGKLVERIGYKTFSYEPPYVKPKMVTTAQDFLKRNMDENIYTDGDGPQQRAEKQVGKDLADMEDQIIRVEEVQASQLLQTGKVTVKGEGVDDEIDFLQSATHLPVLSGTDLWDNSSSQPLEQFRVWRRLMLQDCGKSPNVAILGSDSIDEFIKNTNVKSQLDTRRINLGQLDPIEQADGVTYYGRILDVGIDLYTYDEWYIDPETGIETSMIGSKKCILISKSGRFSVQYGAIQDLKAGNAAVSRFAKSWEKEDPSVRYIMVQSAPLLCLHQPDAVICATVLS